MGLTHTEHINHDEERMMRMAIFSLHHSLPHSHSDMELCYVLKGSAECTVCQRVYRLSPGEMYLTSRYQMHALTAIDDTVTVLVVHLHHDVYELVEPLWKTAMPKVNVLQSGPVYDACAALVKQCAVTYFSDEAMRRSRCLALVLNCLATWLNGTGWTVKEHEDGTNSVITDHRIHTLIDFIEQHYDEKITLNDLAKQVKLSPCHVSHLFHDTVGYSFQEYLNRVRLTEAVRLLNETKLPLLDICMETGLSGTHHLNELMKRYYSVTPRQYVEQRRHRPPIDPNGKQAKQTRFSGKEARRLIASLFC